MTEVTILEHRATFPLPAAPARAYRALVEPGELVRWFAEHATVELRPGGAFEFSGRATLGTPRDGHQRIVALEPGRLIAFRWSIHGVTTEVRWTVIRDGETSTLEIVHRVFGELPFRNANHMIDDLWRLHTGNLMEHLRGGRNVVLPDFSTDKPEVRLSVDIAAPPAKVFRALLDPALMNRWLGGAAKVDLERRAYSYGWSYSIDGKPVEGGPTRIIELIENHKLVTDWGDWRGDPAQPTTRVTWLLEPDAGGTRTKLTIVHDGFAHPVDRSDYQQGWGGFADQLRGVAESA